MSMTTKWAITVAVVAVFIVAPAIGAWFQTRDGRGYRHETWTDNAIDGALIGLFIATGLVLGVGLGAAIITGWHAWMFGGAR